MRRVLDRYEIAELCHGAAPGADSQAGAYGFWRKVPVRRFPADWEAFCPDCHLHRVNRADGSSYCPMAGRIRNQQMLDEFKPDAAVGFPGGNGTKDMAMRVAIAGIPLHQG